MNVKCDDVQPLLFDFITLELPKGRADAVREHIRRCEHCQKAAAEIKATLELLGKAASETAKTPLKLSEERRKKILWSFMHPIMHQIEKHHVLISILLAVIITIIVIVVALKVRIGEEGPETKGPPIDWEGKEGQVVEPKEGEKVPPRPATEDIVVEPKKGIEE